MLLRSGKLGANQGTRSFFKKCAWKLCDTVSFIGGKSKRCPEQPWVSGQVSVKAGIPNVVNFPLNLMTKIRCFLESQNGSIDTVS